MKKKHGNTDVKNAIADMYLKLLKRKAADAITVKEVCDACGITRQAFYYHYHDMQDVMAYLIWRKTDQIGKECAEIQDDYESFRHMMTGLCGFVPVLNRMRDSSLHQEAEQSFLKGIQNILPAISEQHTPDVSMKNADRKLMLEFSSYGLAGYVVKHYQDEEKEETFRHLYHLIVSYRQVHEE